MPTTLKLDLTNPECNPLPEQLQQLVQLMLDGRVSTLAILAEVKQDDQHTLGWINMFETDIDDSESDVPALIGHLQILQREVMRACVPSDIEYLSLNNVTFRDGDEDEDEG
jgi:hypothetical protein